MKNFINTAYKHLTHVVRICIDLIFPQPKHASRAHILSVDDIKALPKSPLRYALWQYSHPLVKEIVWQIKYYENTNLITKIIPYLNNKIKKDILSYRTYTHIALVPVPLSKQRYGERGFNQSEYISHGLYVLLKQEYKHISHETKLVYKKIHTERQTHKNKHERLQNLKHSFALASCTLPTDTLIVLVDDVITTGATTEEISKLFTRAGFQHVEKIALAH